MAVKSSSSHGFMDLVHPTIEAVVLNAISGALAQAFAACQAKDLFAIDLIQILQFMLFTAITAAPNFIFRTALEKRFPTRTIEGSLRDKIDPDKKTDEKDLLSKYGRLNIRNTFFKFLLEQSLSATTNTMLFIVVLGWIKGHSGAHIQHALSKDFWPMLSAGYRFWPMVCLLNLVMVPMEYRPLVGNAAGLVWGFFMTLW